jgi:hypothetical protein
MPNDTALAPSISGAPTVLKNRQARRGRSLARTERSTARVGERSFQSSVGRLGDLVDASLIEPAMTTMPTLPVPPELVLAAPRVQAPALPDPQMPVFLQPDDPALVHAVLLDWLGQQPVAFSRVFVDITGGVLAALWLSNLLALVQAQHGQLDPTTGVFAFMLTAKECQAQTGLSEREQSRARAQLTALGLLAAPGGKASRSRLCLSLQRLAELMLQHSRPTALALSREAAQAEALRAQMLQMRSNDRKQRRGLGQVA